MIELDSEHAEAHFHRAQVLSLLGHSRHAVKDAQQSALLHTQQGNSHGAKKAHVLHHKFKNKLR